MSSVPMMCCDQVTSSPRSSGAWLCHRQALARLRLHSGETDNMDNEP